MYAQWGILRRVFTAPFAQFLRLPLFHIPQDQELWDKTMEELQWPLSGSPNSVFSHLRLCHWPRKLFPTPLQAASSSHFKSQLKGHFPWGSLLWHASLNVPCPITCFTVHNTWGYFSFLPLLTCLFSISFTRIQSPWSQKSGLSSLPHYSQHLIQCLTYNRYSINICWINK